MSTTFEFLPEGLLLMRRIKGLSQAEAARRAGMKGPQLSGYEKGDVEPKLSQLDRILSAYDATLYDLAAVLAAIRDPQRALAAADRADEIRDSGGGTLMLLEGGMLVPSLSHHLLGELVVKLNTLLESVEEVMIGRALRDRSEPPPDSGRTEPPA